MIPELTYDFKEVIWLYQGNGAWHFITLPEAVAKHIRSVITRPRRGWGSIRVAVTIGNTTWNTSIFPYAEVASFILPLKASVRKAEKLKPGDQPKVTICIIE